MTPDPKALAVLLDAARACYGDDSDEVRWLLNPGAVRELLQHTPLTEGDEYERADCPTCQRYMVETRVTFADGSSGVSFSHAHLAACPIAAAWRALGDPRGAADIERAHEEALRDRRQLPRALTHGKWRSRTWAEAAQDIRESSATARRNVSDARGMEAVEEEARGIETWRTDAMRSGRPDLLNSHR